MLSLGARLARGRAADAPYHTRFARRVRGRAADVPCHTCGAWCTVVLRSVPFVLHHRVAHVWCVNIARTQKQACSLIISGVFVALAKSPSL